MSCPMKLPGASLPQRGERLQRRGKQGAAMSEYVVADVEERGDRVVVVMVDAWQVDRLCEKALSIREREAASRLDCIVEVYP